MTKHTHTQMSKLAGINTMFYLYRHISHYNLYILPLEEWAAR